MWWRWTEWEEAGKRRRSKKKKKGVGVDEKGEEEGSRGRVEVGGA